MPGKIFNSFRTYFSEEVKFTKPKKKKPQQEKKSKKKYDQTPTAVAYDLTNVSVFQSDPIVSDSILKPPMSIELKPTVSVTDGKSFLDAVSVVPPAVEKVERNPIPNTLNNTPNGKGLTEAPPPPPPDDINAKGDYKAPLPEKTTFFLLHLSLFRDYLDEEFKQLRLNLTNHPHIKYVNFQFRAI